MSYHTRKQECFLTIIDHGFLYPENTQQCRLQRDESPVLTTDRPLI